MKKQKKKGKSAIVIFGIISFVILIVLVASYVIITHFYKKMNYVPLDKDYVIGMRHILIQKMYPVRSQNL